MRNIYLLIILSVIISVNGFTQETVIGHSQSKYVSISKDPPKPPYLEILQGSLQLEDNDGDKKIGANETTYLKFIIKNSGIGPGLDVKVKISELNNISGLEYDDELNLGQLGINKQNEVMIEIYGKMSIEMGKATFKIWIEEANSFGIDPVYIDVNTQSFIPPNVKIVDYKVSSQLGNTLQKKRPFDLQILIQNIGQGVAENVVVELPLPMNIYCLSSNDKINVGTLQPGEKELLDYNLIANNQYSSNSLSFHFKLNEKYNKYSKDKTITLTMNQVIADNKLVIEGIDREEKKITVGSLTSDVDKNIPILSQKDPNKIALIIGNENYSGNLNAEVNVEYAKNDAKVFKDYAKNTMGISEDNIFLLLDATSGSMRTQIDRIAELIKRMGPDAELIFYYAGHGFPDQSTKDPYLIPVDVDATSLHSAIKLSEVYRKFGETNAKQITIFLDACFSGGGRIQGLLAARGVVIKPKNEVIKGNMLVFAACSGEQSALPYHQEKHGMFTYFLLKKIQESNGNLTYSQLYDYLKIKVGVESLKVNGRPQDPKLNLSPDIENSWKEWHF
ncbi:caspase family protein [Bacteroidota bacterium]